MASSTIPAESTPCVVCGHTGTRMVARIDQRQRKNAEWLICDSCHSAFTRPYQATEQEAEHSRTNAWGRKEEALQVHEEKRELYNRILNRLNGLLPQGGILLDHGASFGGFSQMARKEGWKTVAMDILPEAVDHMNQNGLNAILASTAAAPEVRKKPPFDAIVSIDTCYYWNKVYDEIRSISETLSPGGIFLLRTSDKKWLFEVGRIFGKKEWMRKSVHDHLSVIPVSALLKILRQNGMEVISVSSIDAIPSSRSSLTSKLQYLIGEVAYRLFRLSFSAGFVVIARKQKD